MIIECEMYYDDDQSSDMCHDIQINFFNQKHRALLIICHHGINDIKNIEKNINCAAFTDHYHVLVLKKINMQYEYRKVVVLDCVDIVS